MPAIKVFLVADASDFFFKYSMYYWEIVEVYLNCIKVPKYSSGVPKFVLLY